MGEFNENLEQHYAREEAARKTLRQKIRNFAFIAGFVVGIYFDFTGKNNSILGDIVGPFIVGGAFALLSYAASFGLGI